MNRYSVRGSLPALTLALALNAFPALAGDTLVINGKTASTDVRHIGGSAYVKLENGQKSTQTFWLGRVPGRNINNALADAEGGSHVPVGYDLEGAPIQTKPLLPGARLAFSMLFVVPETTMWKDLVFTLTNNDSQGTNDVRVSLKGE